MKTRTSLVRIAGVVGTLLIFSAASLSAQPKPLDCKSPRTKVARAACASEELQKLDERIETAYLDLLKLTPSPAAEARERFEWLRQLDSCNKAKDDQVVACARSALEQRAEQVDARLADLTARAAESHAAAAASQAQAERPVPSPPASAQHPILTPHQGDVQPQTGVSAPGAAVSPAPAAAEALSFDSRPDAQSSGNNVTLSAEPPANTQTPSAASPVGSPDSSNGSGSSLPVVLFLVGIAGFFWFCAVSCVTYCHENTFVVYQRRRHLVGWSFGGMVVTFLGVMIGPELFTGWNDTAKTVWAALVFVGWWVLQFFESKRLNPAASGGELARILFARAGAAAVTLAISWALIFTVGMSSRQNATAAERVADEVKRAMWLVLLAWVGSTYVGFVCYPDSKKYPKSAFELA